MQSSEEHRIGAQLLVVASLSHLNYVLIRRGRDRGEDTKQWRVNVRLAPPKRLHEVTTTSSTSLGDALLRAYERLRQHDPCRRCHSRAASSSLIVPELVLTED
jgi:hypothetical protein